MATRLRSSTRASTAASDSLADQIETKAGRGERGTRGTTGTKAPRGNELLRLRRIALTVYLLSTLTVIGAIYFAVHDVLRLYPKTITVDTLRGFNARAEFSLRYQTLLYLWLIFNIHSVIYVRLTKKALNPLVETTEKHAQAQKNILTNSFEQIMISSFVQLAFCSFADAKLCMQIIPAMNVIQFVGRIAFFLGYPLYRTLGMTLTMLPNMIMLGYNLYNFGAYLNFY